MSVIGLVTISSPGSGSSAAMAVWIAAVPDAARVSEFDTEFLRKLLFKLLHKPSFGACESAAGDYFCQIIQFLVAQGAAGSFLIRR